MSANSCSICGSAHPFGAVHNHRPLATMWFPPYGNLGAQSAASGTDTGSFEAVLKTHEDKVVELIGNLSDAERAIAYKYLYARGMRIGSVDEDLRKAIRWEIGVK